MNIQIRRVILMFLLLCGLSVKSQAANNKFKVRFRVIDGQANQIKNELDYKLARSLDFCRGHYIATRKNEWSCSKVSKGQISCESFFKCSNITKTFTRESEQKRLAKKLVKTKKENIYKIYVSKMPIGAKLKNKTKKVLAMKKAVPAKKVADPLIFEKEDIELFNEDATAESKKNDSPAKEKLEEDVDSLLVDMDSEDEIIEEVADASEPWFTLPDIKFADIKKKFNLLSFGLQYVSTDSSEGTSYSSFGYSYMPTFEIIDSLFLRPEFGFHKFSFESESFSVSSVIFHLDYVFSSGMYLTLGYGKQTWATEGFDDLNFSGLNYGAGYYFKKKFLGFVDRIFIDLASISSADVTSTAAEMKVGFGFSFF